MKKFLSFILATILIVSVPVCSFAASGFDLSVFSGQDDIKVVYDDMADDADISVSSMMGLFGNSYHSTTSGWVYAYPKVISNKYADVYCLMMEYGASDWAFIDSATVKIGDNRYNFGNISSKRQVERSGNISEYLNIILDDNSIGFMQDLIDHQDEEIKVRLNGKYNNQDFIMSKDLKDSMIKLYNLYVAAGGTRETNLTTIAGTYNAKRTFSLN